MRGKRSTDAFHQQAERSHLLTDAVPLPRLSQRISFRDLPDRLVAENTDESLMLSFCEGDFPAMESLVDRYHRRLHGFFARMLAEPELIDDLIQDTFLRLMKQAVRYQPTGRFSTYLFTIAANLLRDEKKRSRSRDLSLDALPSDTYRLAGGNGSPIALTADEATAQQVRFALDRLKPDLRLAVVLRHYHGFTYEEVANIVGCPSGTVKSRVHLALEQLRLLLGVNGEED